MLELACIVEGHGEVQALPLLVRRILAETNPLLMFEIPRPIRQSRDKLLKPGELERVVELAIRHRRGAVLIVLDTHGDPPCKLGPELLARARRAASHIPMRVVLAHQEWEAWYLAALASLAGRRGLRANLKPPADPEAIRGAKERLAQCMATGTYSETVDQPAFASLFNLDAARSAPSFAKLCRDVRSLFHEARQAISRVTTSLRPNVR